MKFIMCGAQCGLALLVLYVGMAHAHSWDVVIGIKDELKFYTNTTVAKTITLKSQNLTALVYDEVHDMVLYVDKQSNNDHICGYDLSSNDSRCFTKSNGRNIHGLAFDPATETVFFTDTIERSINWISLKPGSVNNANGNLLIKMADGIPRDIVVDSCKGYIYWLNINQDKPTIERALFNGTEREVFENITSLRFNATHNLEPHSLALNPQQQRLYWMQPVSTKEYRLYLSELTRKHKTFVIHVYENCDPRNNHPSNKLTVTKESLIIAGACSGGKQAYKTNWSFNNIRLYFTVNDKPISLAANYKIADHIRGQDCEALKSRGVATKCDEPFCVHGTNVDGQLFCQCTPGYMGERCDVPVCANYCLHGNCSVNDEGFHECRCDSGYSGDRCEVGACHGYCLNHGACSLDKEEKPFCECVASYEGARCEVTKTVIPKSLPITVYVLFGAMNPNQGTPKLLNYNEIRQLP